MSEVEQLYVKLQGQHGGTIPWSQLPRHLQDQFINAVNFLLQVSALKNL